MPFSTTYLSYIARSRQYLPRRHCRASNHYGILPSRGDVAELADAQHLGCCVERRESSSLSVPTSVQGRPFGVALGLSDIMRSLQGGNRHYWCGEKLS